MGLCLIVLAMCVVIASQKLQQTPYILLMTLSRLAVEHVVQTPLPDLFPRPSCSILVPCSLHNHLAYMW